MPDNRQHPPTPEPAGRQSSATPEHRPPPTPEPGHEPKPPDTQAQPAPGELGVPSTSAAINVSAPVSGHLAPQLRAAPSVLFGVQTQVWQGQYPPPEAVERYERVSPGAFDRMIRMAEQLQAAQIENLRRAQEYLQTDTRRGHWLGWSVAILAMGGALGCLALGYPWVASLFLGIPVMAVAKALIESVKSKPELSALPPPQPPEPAS